MQFSLIYGRLLQKQVVLQETANPEIAQLSSLSEFQTSLLFFFSSQKKTTRGRKGSAVPRWGSETVRTLVLLFSVLKRSISPYNKSKGTRAVLHVCSVCPSLLMLGSGGHLWAPSPVMQVRQLFWFLWGQNICLSSTINLHWDYSTCNIVSKELPLNILWSQTWSKQGRKKGKKKIWEKRGWLIPCSAGRPINVEISQMSPRLIWDNKCLGSAVLVA